MCCVIQTHACVESITVHHGRLLSCVCWHCLNIHECLSVPPSSMSSPPPCMLWIAWSPSSTTAPCCDWFILMTWRSVIGCCRSQDHSGALMAEEFKACLISLGYDVENDKQVGAPGQGGGTELVFVRPRSRRAERRSLPVSWLGLKLLIIFIIDFKQSVFSLIV